LRNNAIFKVILEDWRLPVGNATNSLCFTWNHEWQKHGYCMAPAANPKDSERLYFEHTLTLNNRLKAQSEQISAWGKVDSKVMRTEIEELYPKKIQLTCSKTENGSKLSAVRTCWNREMAPIVCEDLKSCGKEIR
jgi:ribonuclease I